MSLDIRKHGYGWAVFEGQTRLSPELSMRHLAESKRDRIAAERRRRVRACLCCGERFMSTGPGHRMCVRCRAEAGAFDPQMEP